MKLAWLSAAFLSSILACGGTEETPSPSSSSGSMRPPGKGGGGAPHVCETTPPPEKPAAACEVTLESPPIAPSDHVPEGTPLTYCSNPPSSGQHYPVWAAFQEYTSPVEWPYLVHSMEHGAVVLLYKCAPPGCPEVVEQLRRIRDEAPADPMCADQPTPHRIILAPSDTIPTKVAAAAWGQTYRADCVDAPTLAAFVRDHAGKGPEDLCFPGRVF